MNFSPTASSTKNERWSINVNDGCCANKKSNTLFTRPKSSDRLRKILIQQDFGGENRRTRSQSLMLQEAEEEERGIGEPSSHTALSCPTRHQSVDSSISSMSSMSSMSSFGTSSSIDINTNNSCRYTSSQSRPLFIKTKNRSKNTLLQYSNMDSMSSFGTINNNDRWRSSTSSKVSAAAFSVRHPTHQRSNDNILSLITTTANGVHQRRRWSATIGNGNGKARSCDDQPIGMVARKASSTYLVTVALA